MKVLIPSKNQGTIPAWDFRTIHNETFRDLEVTISLDELQKDHIAISDPSQAEATEKEVSKEQQATRKA